MVRTRRSRSQSAKQERTLFGVPERFMKPRIVLLVVVTLLVLFGLLMIYSASSVTAMTNPDMGNNPFYFVTKQGIIALVGTVLAIGLAVLDYRKLCRAWWHGGDFGLGTYAVCRYRCTWSYALDCHRRLHHSAF